MEILLTPSPLDQAALRAADYAARYEQEKAAPEMRELLELSHRQAMINASRSQASTRSTSSSSPSRSSSVALGEDKTPATAKQQVESGTNTGEMVQARAKLHHGSIVRNTKEALKVNHQRGHGEQKIFGIFTARHAAEKHQPVSYRDLAKKSQRSKHDSWATAIRAENRQGTLAHA